LTCNAELETLIKRENIVRSIRSRTLQWAAHVIRTDTLRTVKKINGMGTMFISRKAKAEMDRPNGREFKKDETRNWREMCKHRRLWNGIIKQAKTHHGL
jgi:hypothetical protein